MAFKEPTAERLDLVSFYVDDVARGIENSGLTPVEARAIRLLHEFESSKGRETSSDGFKRAVDRLLDNQYGAEEGATEMAAFAVADLAVQRRAQGMVEVAGRFADTGKDPGGHDMPAWLLEDLAGDLRIERSGSGEDLTSALPELREEALGRFHASLSPSDIHGAVLGMEAIPADERTSVREWIAGRDRELGSLDEEFYEPRRGRLVDVLEMAEAAEREPRDAREAADDFVRSVQSLGFGEPRLEEEGANVRVSFAMPSAFAAAEAMESSFHHAVQIADMTIGETGISEDGRRLFVDVRADGNEPHRPSFRDWQEYEAGEPRLAFATGEEYAAEHARFFGLPSASAQDPDPAERIAGLAAETVRLQDGVRAGLVEEGRLTSHLEAFDEARLDIATGKDAAVYQPFDRASSTLMDRAELEVGEVVAAISHRDPTIVTDMSLERAVRFMEASGFELNDHRAAALERAFVRAEQMESGRGEIWGRDEKARMMVFDVATQEEARGMEMTAQGGVLNAARGAAIERPARALLGKFGIRTLEQENPGREDLGYIAAGRYDMVSEFHRAGLDLGLAWARTGSYPEIDARMGRLVDAARAESFGELGIADGSREARSGIAGQARSVEVPSGVRARGKGPETLGDVVEAAIAETARSGRTGFVR